MRPIVFALLLLLIPAFAFAVDAETPDAPAPPDATGLQVRITHRVFISFADTLTVEVGEEFWAGDTEFSAVVERFNPDFGIREGGEVVERSAEPHNPAFLIRVYEGEEQVDEVWAFLGDGAPHYRRDSLLGFQVLSFEWRGERMSQPAPREGE